MPASRSQPPRLSRRAAGRVLCKAPFPPFNVDYHRPSDPRLGHSIFAYGSPFPRAFLIIVSHGAKEAPRETGTEAVPYSPSSLFHDREQLGLVPIKTSVDHHPRALALCGAMWYVECALLFAQGGVRVLLERQHPLRAEARSPLLLQRASLAQRAQPSLPQVLR
jgi:hypothetical protein